MFGSQQTHAPDIFRTIMFTRECACVAYKLPSYFAPENPKAVLTVVLGSSGVVSRYGSPVATLASQESQRVHIVDALQAFESDE